MEYKNHKKKEMMMTEKEMETRHQEMMGMKKQHRTIARKKKR